MGATVPVFFRFPIDRRCCGRLVTTTTKRPTRPTLASSQRRSSCLCPDQGLSILVRLGITFMDLMACQLTSKNDLKFPISSFKTSYLDMESWTHRKAPDCCPSGKSGGIIAPDVLLAATMRTYPRLTAEYGRPNRPLLVRCGKRSGRTGTRKTEDEDMGWQYCQRI